MWTHISRLSAFLTSVSLVVVFAVACGPRHRVEGPPRAVAPTADGDFPEEYRSWTKAAARVRDEESGEVRYFHRNLGVVPDASGHYPKGAILVKVHHDLADESMVTRVDVRRRVDGGPFDGWAYESFDPATRRRFTIDAETCHLCHATAPADGTFTRF